MNGQLKSYSVYKDSGIPLLGDVPRHWDLRSLGSLVSAISLRSQPDLPLLSVVREKGVVLRSLTEDRDNHNFIPDDLKNYKVVRKGNLVINKMKAWQGSLGVAPMDGIVSPAYFVFDFKIDNARFGQALLRSKTYVGFFARASDGVRIGQWDLSVDGMKRIPMVVPPPQEQSAIVRFLDHADRRIQRYIRAKKKQIALLKEQKQGLIQNAVTRGLAPNTQLKPSGIGWLGDVPEHWKVSRLKFEASHIVDCLHSTPKYVSDGEYPAIRTADIEPGRLLLENARKVNRDQFDLWTSRLVPKADDILYSREGERFGIAALVPKSVRLCISQRMMVFRIRPTQKSSFIMWQLNSSHVYAQAAADVIGATSPHINVERIRNFWVVLPPLEEQKDIAEMLEAESRALGAATDKIEREIRLVREYRTRMIADVVTGKFDVREAAAQLPREDAGLDSSEEDEATESDGKNEEPYLDTAPEKDEA